MRILRDGNAVKRVEYDHNTGIFTNRKRVAPKPYIVLCGLHSLYLPQMRQVLDLKIFLDTDESIRCYWKLKRDESGRGHEKSEIMKQIEERREDAKRYIYPQKQYADLIIRYFDKTIPVADMQMDNAYHPALSVEFLIDVSVNAEPLLALMQERGIAAELTYDNLLHQRIVIENESLHIGKDVWREIASQVILQIDDLAGENIIWEDGLNGAVQLIVMLVIGDIMRRD